eukprot:570477-Prymnesium_polylepis.1
MPHVYVYVYVCSLVHNPTRAPPPPSSLPPPSLADDPPRRRLLHLLPRRQHLRCRRPRRRAAARLREWPAARAVVVRGRRRLPLAARPGARATLPHQPARRARDGGAARTTRTTAAARACARGVALRVRCGRVRARRVALRARRERVASAGELCAQRMQLRLTTNTARASPEHPTSTRRFLSHARAHPLAASTAHTDGRRRRARRRLHLRQGGRHLAPLRPQHRRLRDGGPTAPSHVATGARAARGCDRAGSARAAVARAV